MATGGSDADSIKRPQFGTRLLTDRSKVFEHNAWYYTCTSILTNLYETDAGRYWDEFYTQHQNRFFKDRHWLFTEFPELAPKESTETESIVKLGCGVGNTVFPVLQTNNDPNLFVYCCDFSSTAIELVKSHPDYHSNRCHAFVCDIVDDSTTLPFPENSLDIIVLIFVLSAIHPNKMQYALNRLSKHLKPGGLILFRDYGRYDLAQLRFKKGKCFHHFYLSLTLIYAVSDELREMMTSAGLIEEQNTIDRRLQVNRGRQLTMYRVWIQCKYRKPVKT
uniref:tRNA N(3)-methylcytidine methyltransferase n=1 Tax=Saccoglossus kowalevskii TaxID=10224 RepID=A0ABM0LTT1_SACKO|nr:PREDICTED: methyltransferase-like protein 2-A-like [Saccoglossus kowalevskii]